MHTNTDLKEFLVVIGANSNTNIYKLKRSFGTNIEKKE